MKLLGFDINIARSGSRAAAPAAIKSFDTDAWLRGDDLPTGPVMSNAYQQVVWVYRAINALAEQVANVPFLFSAGERGRENLITSGPLLDFYAQPHPHINRFQYWELRVIWLMLRGECVRIPVFQDGGGLGQSALPRLKSVLILDPARFQHIIEDNQLIGWRYTGLGPQAPLASQVFLPEEVWFEKLPNPFDFWRGLAPLSAAALAAQTDFAAGSFMRGLIENNADTGVMVRTQEWLSQEQQEQIIAALKKRKRRAGEADRPMLLQGIAEIVKPQLSSTDLQFLENRRFSRAEICAAFGVPEELVTTTEYAKYDVMAGARLNFIENRIAPLCSRLEAEEAVTVQALQPGASGWFDLDSLPILQEARRNRLAAARTGFDMGIPFNELNRVLDLGFKALPWGDRGYLPAKLQEVGRDEANAGVGIPVKVVCEQDPFLRAARLLEVAGTRVANEGQEVLREKGPLTPSVSLSDRESVTEGQALINTGLQPGEPAAVDAGAASAASRAAEKPLKGLSLSSPPGTALKRGVNESSQVLRKLRRFLFEQRSRALAGLAGWTSASAATPLLDAASENALLEARLQGLVGEDQLAPLLELNEANLQNLHELLAAHRAETPEQLTLRIKSFYNEAAPHPFPLPIRWGEGDGRAGERSLAP